jgi:uroporphyrinogen-III decarboxylase
MNEPQWRLLLDIIAGKDVGGLPAGFIIDSPWLPGWSGLSTLDYFTNDELWFEANKRAIETFPEAMFLPGFWSEYGMCTEPSAFGAKCSFHEHELPYADKIIREVNDIDRLTVPNPARDGLAPFVLNRLKLKRRKIEAMGHTIRFAVARGPLNIASFLMGTTEFLIGTRTDPDKIHTLLKLITDYIIQWLKAQQQAFDSIDGILILDDIVGFCGQPDFEAFAKPYLKAIFNSLDVQVRFFHNDADGKVCSPFLSEIGVNLFNFSFLHSLEEMKQWTDNKVTLLGNIPPRDVLAMGSPEQVTESVMSAAAGLKDMSRIILSCGGGVPDGVSTANLRAFLGAARRIQRKISV